MLCSLICSGTLLKFKQEELIITTLTNYAVLNDSSFDAWKWGTGQKKLTCNVPADLMQGVGTTQPILSYIVYMETYNNKTSMGI